MYKLIQFTWGVIQTVLGFFIFLFIKLTKENYLEFFKGAIVIYFFDKGSFFSGGSFGCFLLIKITNKNYKNLELTLKHEYGHSIQSLIFGPLYLFVIGIPSMINNIRARFNKEIYNTYFERYPEKWADKLGGVKR